MIRLNGADDMITFPRYGRHSHALRSQAGPLLHSRRQWTVQWLDADRPHGRKLELSAVHHFHPAQRAASGSVRLSVCLSVYHKLSCRRETARCFMSLNILLRHSSHSTSFKMTLLSRACVNPSIETMSVYRTVSEIF